MKRKKRGPGHPVTTGSADIPPVFFRISKAQRKTLAQEGAQQRPRLTVNQAAKRRCFPEGSE